MQPSGALPDQKVVHLNFLHSVVLPSKYGCKIVECSAYREIFVLFLERQIRCFIPGECVSGNLLRSTLTLDSEACLRFCKNIDGCKYFNFHPLDQTCAMFSECEIQVNDKCQGMLDNQINTFLRDTLHEP